MTDVTCRIQYTGDPARAGMLVQMLEDQGVQVDWQPPQERRSLGADLNEVVVQLVVIGTAAGIKSGIELFRGRSRHGEVEIDGEPDDGGFLDDGD